MNWFKKSQNRILNRTFGRKRTWNWFQILTKEARYTTWFYALVLSWMTLTNVSFDSFLIHQIFAINTSLYRCSFFCPLPHVRASRKHFSLLLHLFLLLPSKLFFLLHFKVLFLLDFKVWKRTFLEVRRGLSLSRSAISLSQLKTDYSTRRSNSALPLFQCCKIEKTKFFIVFCSFQHVAEHSVVNHGSE